MRKLEIYRILRQHRQLAERRSANFDQNKAAKVIVYLAGAFIMLYLVFVAILLSLIANESRDMTTVEFIMGISPFMLTMDFLLRFVVQQTPAQMVRPYLLLPIPRYACINGFILSSLLSKGNFTWFALLVPYVIMSVLFKFGLLTAMYTLVLFGIFVLSSSQLYAIVRTLINDTVRYWLLPVLIFAGVFSPCFWGGGFDVSQVFYCYSHIGSSIESGSPWPVVLGILMLIVLTIVNRQIQYTHVMTEIEHREKSYAHHTLRMAFLDRHGDVGQYIKLEIRTILRNKNPRKSFLFATLITLLFSMIISFTDIYDTPFMNNFWCFYTLVIYGAMMLVKIMCNEGNYIDCLMTRKENILCMLHAKYIVYIALLAIPFTLMLPTVITGKWSLLMLTAYAVFTAGFQYYILFHMAIFNKQTMPLNTKFISKSGIENNYMQIVAEMVNFIIPMAIIQTLQTFLPQDISYVIMLAIGAVFIATHRLWLRQIYRSLMKRRYSNMESFRATR